MKNPFNARAPNVDTQAIQATIRQALVSAGLDPISGPMHGVTETIRRSLASAGLSGPSATVVPEGDVIDVTAHEVRPGSSARSGSQPGPSARPGEPGSFETHAFGKAAIQVKYKVYVPLRRSDLPPPVLVMLHGCTQTADDFAAGTQMNRLADEHGFLVVYPEQPAQANASRCWNWFKVQDQARGAGEPALIAGIVHEVVKRHGADGRRIFVAGLSAGAAMAVILGETHPELFAGVGAHSGLPYGSAHDMPSALAAMKGGRGKSGQASGLPGMAAGKPGGATRAVPTIVFHGDRDHTVQHSNGVEIARQASAAHATHRVPELQQSTQRHTAPGGRGHSRTVHTDAAGQVHIESWTLHGAGHAWSGGSAQGTHTDTQGPDASAEMVRFFLALPDAGTA